MPLIGCQFAESRANALGAARGTLEPSWCEACGHIYNRAFEPERIDLRQCARIFSPASCALERDG
jgi:hypothetical protein